jgi:acyl-CoA synthetase (AMP-forming)/AMP-acid ligase II/thioesterase domain-containing protein
MSTEPPDQSIGEMIGRRSKGRSTAPAILATEGTTLTYSALTRQTDAMVVELRQRGILRQDRVAIVLPNGPRIAGAFLGVCAAAAGAPLNPGYRADDFDFYLDDLDARAVVVEAGHDGPVRSVAARRGIAVLEVITGEDGIDHLHGPAVSPPARDAPASPDDVALLLHTSGTTSRPKVVPLTHHNMCTSARNVARTLRLGPADRGLNVMPLFHIHGLVAGLLASIDAGASVVCTPGFDSERFFDWLEEFEPTWYTAVPTMHQAILTGAAAHADIVESARIRLIRSSSASLPGVVMRELENTFRTPVIEAYGMTEAAHQMACNPLPPAVRKSGSVGMAAGPDVTIMDGAGRRLEHGEIGEIVVRGDNITSGYLDDPEANATAFVDGWFRTGDEGVIDGEGYLRITGRLKEMINRGGEKVVPREVDEVLLAHPAVAQAVAFSVPHVTLGEDLAAAVVLRDGEQPTMAELREHCFDGLAGFKVPSTIVAVRAIPKGPSGKLRRIGLADQLPLTTDFESPQSDRERLVAETWAEILGVEPVGRLDNFFLLGGDSLRAIETTTRLSESAASPLEPPDLFRMPTVVEFARLLDDPSTERNVLVPLQTGDDRSPVFYVPGHGGDVFTFRELVGRLHPGRAAYAFAFPPEAAGDDAVACNMLPELAHRFVDAVVELQPAGPYHFVGYCFGGEVLAEMIAVLEDRGERIGTAIVIHAHLSGSSRRMPVGRGLLHAPRATLRTMAGRAKGRVMRRRMATDAGKQASYLVSTPRPIETKVLLVRPLGELRSDWDYDPLMGWGDVTTSAEVRDIEGDRVSIFTEPRVEELAELLRSALAQ